MGIFIWTFTFFVLSQVNDLISVKCSSSFSKISGYVHIPDEYFLSMHEESLNPLKPTVWAGIYAKGLIGHYFTGDAS